MSIGLAYYPANLTFDDARKNQPTFSPAFDAPDSLSSVLTGEENPVTYDSNSGSPTRTCSVRGCIKTIPSDSDNKMCETCRGRHRIYATTKRAKRKLEKAAVSQGMPQLLTAPQTVWVPINQAPSDASHFEVMTSNSNHTLQQGINNHLNESVAAFPSIGMNRCDVNPRVFTSRTFELAGALTPQTPSVETIHFQTTTSTPTHAAAKTTLSRSSSRKSEILSYSTITVPTALPPEDFAPRASSSTSASRFCSVKGCKAIIPNDYFFKMCEPCRDRYRGYGTTKRAKAKRDRLAADTELGILREAEDKRRIEAGLPELSSEECIGWENNVTGEQLAANQDPPLSGRMCTVSHCHTILPGHYQYRRCEQHRIQNRYHSKLKRVREKEGKAKGILGDSHDLTPSNDGDSEVEKTNEVEPSLLNKPIEGDCDTLEMAAGGTVVDIPLVASEGQRTNHVCSVKSCCNLLAPSVPWKMCDSCRARDRMVRQNKKLRDMDKSLSQRKSVESTSRVNARRPSSKVNVTSGKHVAKTSTASSTSMPHTLNRGMPVFTNLLLPEEPHENSSTRLHAATNSTPLTTSNSSLSSAESHSVFLNMIPLVPALPSSPTRPCKQRATSNKPKETDAHTATTSAKIFPGHNPASEPQPHHMIHAQSQYQVPYYLPQMYSINPYTILPLRQDAASLSSVNGPRSYPAYPSYPYSPLPHYAHQPYQLRPPYPYIAPYMHTPYNVSQPQSWPYPIQGYSVLPYGHQLNYYSLTSQTENASLSISDELKQNQNEPPSTATALTSSADAVPDNDLSVPAGGSSSRAKSMTESEAKVRETLLEHPLDQHDSGKECPRQCRVCDRSMPLEVNNIMCERCRTRMKKRSAKVKLRLRLEPRKWMRLAR